MFNLNIICPSTGDKTEVLSPIFVSKEGFMNTVLIEVPFIVHDDGQISFVSINLLKRAEALVKQRLVLCVICGKHYLRSRGNPKYCPDCREENNHG
jgi:hypothetical protein